MTATSTLRDIFTISTVQAVCSDPGTSLRSWPAPSGNGGAGREAGQAMGEMLERRHGSCGHFSGPRFASAPSYAPPVIRLQYRPSALQVS